MDNKKYSVEELMLDEGYLDFCLHEDSAYRPYWERVIELNPDQKNVFEKATAGIRMLSGSLSEKEILLQVEKVKHQLRSSKSTNKYPNTIHERQLTDEMEIEDTKPFKGFIFYSAGAFAILCFGLYFLSPSLTKTPSQTTKVATIIYNSKPGERRTIQLRDGSTVLLNGNSGITIKNDFNKTKREVTLKGEAFFTVAKNAVKPFIVESDNFSATVIGTAFYVHARDPEKEYRVDLLEGKVKLSAHTYSLFLTPGEEGKWNTLERNLNKINFDTLQLKQWITGKISFNKTPMHQAVEELKKWYAVDIEIANKELENKTISGDYNNVSLDSISKVLSFTLSCKYHYENNKVIIE